MENTKRLDYIDYTKGFGILLVILGHIYDTSNPIKIWLYSFHMPLFFIISGFFAKNIKFKVLFKKKFKSLIIPYISFGIITMGLMIVTNSGLNGEFKEYVYFFITGVGRDALWFLPCLFLIEVIFNIIIKIKNNKYKIFIVFILFLIGLCGAHFIKNMILTTLYRAFVGLGFYSIGNYMYTKLKTTNISTIILVLLLIGSSILAIYNGCVDLWGLNFGNKFIYVFCSIVNSFCIIIIFKKIFDNKEIESLRFFGRNTLIIMSTQQLIINYINKFTGVDYYNTLYGIVTFLVVILIEIPIIYVIKNYLSFMIGKFPKKKNAQTITG
jgi:fucose 4-O-acetylase-like acetyltransferase